jgi:hypothetical protein
VMTTYFSGFLVAAEGLLLVYRLRSRPSVVALLAQAVVLAPWGVQPRYARNRQ